MKRPVARFIQGVIIAAGAPLGWLITRAFGGVSPATELAGNPALYLYMLLGTVAAFGIFGYLLGSREERLIDLNRELDALAITDSLTGLRNARYFHARLAEEDAERTRTGAPLAIAIIDIDFFKRINDQYGHVAGDDVLTNVARAISAVTRHAETEARVGGEEFALLLPGSDGVAAHDAAERVRGAIASSETPLDGITVRVTASAGVASTAEHPGLSARDLYRAADEALYRAKAEGRNRTVVAGQFDGSSRP